MKAADTIAWITIGVAALNLVLAVLGVVGMFIYSMVMQGNYSVAIFCASLISAMAGGLWLCLSPTAGEES